MQFNQYYMTYKPGKGESVFATSEPDNDRVILNLLRNANSGLEPSYQLQFCEQLNCFLYFRVNALKNGFDARGSKFVYIWQPVNSGALPAQYLAPEFPEGTGEELFNEQELHRKEFNPVQASVLEGQNSFFSLSEEDLSKIIYTLFFDVTVADKRVVVECDSADFDTKKHIAAFLHEIVPELFRSSLSVNISDSYFSPTSRINIISNGVNYDIDNSIFVIGYSNGKLSVKSDLNNATEILRCLSRCFAGFAFSSISEYKEKTRTYAEFTSKLHGSDLKPLAAFTAAAIPNLGGDISPEMTGLELLNEYSKVFANINRANIKGAWINNEKPLNRLIGISVKKVFAADNQNDINNLAVVLYDFIVPNGNESGPALCASVLDEFYGKDGCSGAVRSAFLGLKAHDSEKALKVLKCLDNHDVYKERPEKPTLEFFRDMCKDACDVYILSLYGDEQLANWLFEFVINDSFEDFKPLDNYNTFLGTTKYHELLEAVKTQIIEFLPAVEPENFVAVTELYEYALTKGEQSLVPEKPELKHDKAKVLYDMWAKDNTPNQEEYWGKFLNCFMKSGQTPENFDFRKKICNQFFDVIKNEDKTRAMVLWRALENPDAFERLPEKLTVDVFWEFADDDFKAPALARASAEGFAECFYNEPQAVDNENLESIFKSFCNAHKNWGLQFVNNTLFIFNRELEAVAGNPANAAEMAELRKKAVDLQKRLPLLKLVLDTARLVDFSSDDWRCEFFNFISERVNSFVIREAEKVVWGNILGLPYTPEYEKRDRNLIDYSKTGKKVSFEKIREIGAAIDKVSLKSIEKNSSNKKNANTEYDIILNQRLDEYSDSQYIYDSVRSLTDFLLGKKFSNPAHGIRAALLLMMMFDKEKSRQKYCDLIDKIISAVKKSFLENRKNFEKEISDIARILFRFVDADDNEWNIIRKRISEYNPEIYSLLVNAKPDVFEDYAERSAGYAGAGVNQFRINVPDSGSDYDESVQPSQQVNTDGQRNGPEQTVLGDGQNRRSDSDEDRVESEPDEVGNSGSKKSWYEILSEFATGNNAKSLAFILVRLAVILLLALLFIETNRILWTLFAAFVIVIIAGALSIAKITGKFKNLLKFFDRKTVVNGFWFYFSIFFFLLTAGLLKHPDVIATITEILGIFKK